MSKKHREPKEEPEEEEDEEVDEEEGENLTPWDKQQRKKRRDPDALQEEYMGLAREILDNMKADKKKGGMPAMAMFAQESKELRQAYADLNHVGWDERCTLSIAKELSHNNSNPEQVAQIAFDIVQAVKAKFKAQKEEIKARIKKEQEKSPADHGTFMESSGRLPPNVHGEI